MGSVPAAVAAHTPHADAYDWLAVQGGVVERVQQSQSVFLQDQHHLPALQTGEGMLSELKPALFQSIGPGLRPHLSPRSRSLSLLGAAAVRQLLDDVTDREAAATGRQVLLLHLQPAQRTHCKALADRQVNTRGRRVVGLAKQIRDTARQAERVRLNQINAA